MSVATIADICVALGRPDIDPNSIEAKQYALWIGYAENIIRARLGDLSKLDQSALKQVIVEAVASKAKNPDPISRRDVAVDDGRVSVGYNNASGDVTIRPEWWALLTPLDQRSRAFGYWMGKQADDPAYADPGPNFGLRPDLTLQWAWPISAYVDEPPC